VVRENDDPILTYDQHSLPNVFEQALILLVLQMGIAFLIGKAAQEPLLPQEL
jgi:hypothetical protein